MKNILNKIFKIIIVLFTIFSISIFLYLCRIYNQVKAIDLNKLDLNSQIIINDKDGNFVANLSEQYYSKCDFEDIPIDLINAIIAIEDNNFYNHNGIDYKAITRASIKNILSLGYKEGASTITQQLVKNIYLTNDKNIERKLKEIIISLKLESLLSKDQILECYLNNVLFGGRVYGVSEAAKYYFSKDVNELNYIECAFLAGVVQRPNKYNAFNYIDAADERKNLVLFKMYEQLYITEEQYNYGINTSISEFLNMTDLRENLGIYADYIDYILPQISISNVSTTITTAMDKDIQKFISSIMNNEYDTFPDNDIKCGIVVIENSTGNILGIGGNRSEGLRNLNYATQTLQQPASTIKPILDYAPAFEYLGYMTQSNIVDEPYYYSDGYLVKNWDYLYKGNITIKQALAQSRNIPSIKLFNEVGHEKAFEFASRLGIKTDEAYHESMAIGGFSKGFSVLEMTSAFSAFPNMGVYNEPRSIINVKSNTTSSFEIQSSVAMKESTAFYINDTLHHVLANTIYDLDNKYYCCKTGQSNYDDQTKLLYNLPDNAIKDSWIIGYTKDLTVGVWVGYDVISNTSYLNQSKNNIGKFIVRDILNTFSTANNTSYSAPYNLVRMGVSIYNGNIYEKGLYDNTVYDYFYKGFYPLNKKEDDILI